VSTYHDVLEYTHVAEKTDVLKGAREALLVDDIGLETMNLFDMAFAVADPDRSFIRSVLTRYAVENCGFPGAVRAYERRDFAFVDMHRDTIDGTQASEGHDEVVDFQYRIF